MNSLSIIQHGKFSMKHYLALRDVYKSYTQGLDVVPVIKGISGTFYKGNTYALTGISGSGKSTLIHLLAGLDVPTSGAVIYNDHAIQQFSEQEKSSFLNKSIGLVFQYPYLIKEMTILENVMLKGLIAGKKQSECEQEARNLLTQVGLSSKMIGYPGQLSGGQQQRVALARALMNQPEFLLADEPTGNLDMQTGNTIIDLVLQAQKDWGMGVIISSHDEYVTERMSTVYVVKDGKLA